MIVIITGTPGTGKTSVAKALKARLGKEWRIFNDAEFCKKHRIGSYSRRERELEVPLEKLEAGLKKELKKEKNAILEGHLLCELKLKADLVVVLRTRPEILQARLRNRKYSELKLLDNSFCEQTSYCLQKALKNFPKSIVFEAVNEKGIKESTAKILKEVKKKIQ